MTGSAYLWCLLGAACAAEDAGRVCLDGHMRRRRHLLRRLLAAAEAHQ